MPKMIAQHCQFWQAALLPCTQFSQTSKHPWILATKFSFFSLDSNNLYTKSLKYLSAAFVSSELTRPLSKHPSPHTTLPALDTERMKA
jgi:hypothetical protein